MSSTYQTQDGVAVIMLDNPPVNGLGHALRTHIMEGLAAAEADGGVKAVVLIGAGRGFSGGADIREFNTPKMGAEPSLRTVLDRIEGLAKPVVAAVHGIAMGGGLELALACHYRVAVKGAEIALPEVKIGILPGAGGTQRLPRVIGLEQALDMIVSGNARRSEALAPLGLFDEMIAGDLGAGAVAFAQRVAAARPLPRVRDRVIAAEGAAAFLAKARNDIARRYRGYPAPLKCLACVEAALTMPFDDGLAFERKGFQELVETTESKALRHAFFAERQAAKIPDVGPETLMRPIKSAAVVGCGTMGGGIAMTFANAGIPVTVLETQKEALDRGLALVRRNYEATAKRGRMSASDVETRMGHITPTLEFAGIAQADIVIEAVFEEMDVKKDVFRKLDATMKEGAILATNTSTLDVDEIASVTARPGDVIGTHFFSPANVMRLLEVVRGKETSKEVVATTMMLARTIGKIGVLSGVCDGFIGNRMLEPYVRQSLLMVLEGALPEEVDRALEDWGMAMGPFRMYDLAGNDVGYRIRQRRYLERPRLKPFYEISDRICEAGRYGQKTGKGWYRYEPGDRTAHADPEVARIVGEVRAARGLTPRAIPASEIVERCIFALVNEAAALIEEGIALRASDVDVVYLSGYGFPRYRGGPMFYADTVGLANVAARMSEFSRNPLADPEFWRPAPLLARLAGEGKRFNG
ncbi:MAG: 3-hydroxyacyl-CoA dehydrogenase NAD-binding domain-containing protein [Hyphomicrobiaceae bacterium]